MIDYKNIRKYSENNRIEAKKAIGGLPESIWETYSAFANTLGGVILLGVTERPDKTLDAVGVPDPEWLVEEFLELVNDTRVVNKNILDEDDIAILEPDKNGKEIVAIRVPRAEACDRPIYIGDSVQNGSYRRNGEGDYKCTREEISEMLRAREAALASPSSEGDAVISHLTKNVTATESGIASSLGIGKEELAPILQELSDKNYIVPISPRDGESQESCERVYRLRIKPIHKKQS